MERKINQLAVPESKKVNEKWIFRCALVHLGKEYCFFFNSTEIRVFSFSKEIYPTARLDPTKLARFEAPWLENKPQEQIVNNPIGLEESGDSCTSLVSNNNVCMTPSFEPEDRNSSFESILLKKINKTPSTCTEMS